MLKDQSKRDIYSFLLKILGDNPPLVEIDMEELLNRVQDNVVDIKITTRKIKDTLKNWQKILDEQSALYQVFEWKDDTIHILDNLFLFYLRWTDI